MQFTHLDSHMGSLFTTPELFRVYEDTAHQYGVPNLIAPAGSPRSHRKDEIAPYALVISKDLQIHPGIPHKRWLKHYESMLSPLGPGVYELIVHLGYDDAELEGITGGENKHWGARWRQADLEVVRSQEFRNFLHDQGFVLITWRDLARAMQAEGPKVESAKAAGRKNPS